MSISTLVDNESNARAKEQHAANGGQLAENIEESKFQNDQSHQKSVFSQAFYNLVSAPVKVNKVRKG